MNTLLRKLETARGKYESVISEVESKLSDKIKFEFWITYQPSDGFVVVQEQNNRTLVECLVIIKSKGCLSLEDYKSILN